MASDLRDYQSAAIESVFTEWQENRSTLGVAATGLGKTVIFAAVIQRVLRSYFPRKTKAMVLANGKELIFQAVERIQEFTGLGCEIEMGEYRASGDNLLGKSDVIVSTIQTQCAGGDGGGRMSKFDPMNFGVLILDEADGATSASFRRAIDYYSKNPNLKILGVTATPDRTDEESLGQIFQTVAFDLELLWAIENGWLVDIHQRTVHLSGADFSHIRTTAGDLNGADLAAVMEGEMTVQEMVIGIFESMFDLPENSLLNVDPKLWPEQVDGKIPKRTLAFGASVRHAETLANIFNRLIPGMAAFVCGKTDKDLRRKINADFNDGKIPLLCNYGTHAVGFDSPGIELIVNGRPTKSRRLFAQIAGRCTRTLRGVIDGLEMKEERLAAIAASQKPFATLLDPVGNAGKHKLIGPADILGGKVSDEAVRRATLKIRSGKGSFNVREILDEEEELLRQEREQKRLEEEARKNRIVAKGKYTSQKIDPFDVFDIQPIKSRGWDDGKSLSEKQRGFLTRAGIDPDSIPYAQGKQLIGEMMNRWQNKLCSLKQAALLKKYGYETNVSFERAGEIITAIKANGWKRPAIIEDGVEAGVPDSNIPF